MDHYDPDMKYKSSFTVYRASYANFIDLKSLVVWKGSIKSSLDLIMILLPIVINALIGTYIVTFVIVVSTFIIYHLAIG